MLSLQRYRLIFKVERTLELNEYSGSMLRGIFGHALRRLGCVTGQQECRSCLLYRHCSYAYIFETPPPSTHRLQQFSRIPAPFVIEPPAMGDSQRVYQKGELFEFGMVLIGDATQYLPLIVAAWQQAMGQGVGRNKARLTMEALLYCPAHGERVTIYRPERDQQILQHGSDIEAINATPAMVTLHLKTPLRIKRQGTIIREEIGISELLMALVRRYYLLEEFFGTEYQQPDFSAYKPQIQQIAINSELEWFELFRYSNRQQSKTPLGGVMGRIHLTGLLHPFLPLLNQGQWFHLGSKTSFGLGQYTLEYS